MRKEIAPHLPLPGESGQGGGKTEFDVFPIPPARLIDGTSRRPTSVILRDVQRLRAGIAVRKTLRVRDVDRLRALGVCPFGGHRVFRVARAGDQILAIWREPGEESPAPHWSEVTRFLEKIEEAIRRAMHEMDFE